MRRASQATHRAEMTARKARLAARVPGFTQTAFYQRVEGDIIKMRPGITLRNGA